MLDYQYTNLLNHDKSHLHVNNCKVIFNIIKGIVIRKAINNPSKAPREPVKIIVSMEQIIPKKIKKNIRNSFFNLLEKTLEFLTSLLIRIDFSNNNPNPMKTIKDKY